MDPLICDAFAHRDVQPSSSSQSRHLRLVCLCLAVGHVVLSMTSQGVLKMRCSGDICDAPKRTASTIGSAAREGVVHGCTGLCTVQEH